MKTTRTVAALVAAAACLALAATPAAAAPNAQDQQFLVGAHQANLAEIASGQAALAEATTPGVREMGQQLITDHQALDAQVTAVAQQLGVTLPDAPTPEQQAALAEVQAEEGQDFDTAWLYLQIESHRATLALGEQELAGGAEQAVKDLATASAPVVQRHLDHALALAQELGVDSVPAGTGGQAAASERPLGLALSLVGGLLLAGAAGLVVRSRRTVGATTRR
ncbi:MULTISPECIES: DUF4142 domain-containing protein [Cellulomonas]|uniref:DUF4142 domain-containing protein n=1 Tax=Cellulomonas TaxID=1707 RepID=UPI0010A82E6C|nr:MULTISPECIES: DUF4142 domain-containing protein [Cellulomonas]